MILFSTQGCLIIFLYLKRYYDSRTTYCFLLIIISYKTNSSKTALNIDIPIISK